MLLSQKKRSTSANRPVAVAVDRGAYENPAGLADHWRQGATSWADLSAYRAWASKVRVAVLDGSPVILSLW